MDRALELASAGWGRVHPNPLVGAVVVRDGQIVGEGWHAEYGGPHAEVVAIEQAGDRAAGATLYVSLEPCAHHGKTPPCTDAIRAARLARVVYAATDPDRNAGGGAGVLADLGVDVTGGVRAEESRSLNMAFHHIRESGTPFVTLKLAVSLDGRLSRAVGQPTAVTGEVARSEVHKLRAGFDAILVGSGTVRADDPRLTVRGEIEPRSPPVRVVLDSTASIPVDSNLIASAGTVPVWVLTGPAADVSRTRALQAAGARIIPIGSGPGGLDVHEGFARLWQEGIKSILCEGGGRLGATLLEAGIVQRLHLYVAPVLFGPDGPEAFPVEQAFDDWSLIEVRQAGQDALLILEQKQR